MWPHRQHWPCTACTWRSTFRPPASRFATRLTISGPRSRFRGAVAPSPRRSPRPRRASSWGAARKSAYGIVLRGELVESGDWTGFGGAARVLSEPGIDLAVLETARGGILLRGIGYARKDGAVGTNVSADHLGLQGIDTIEELAEVKGAVTRITRRGGWAVLNAEDPLVWAMRRESRARRYAFSLDPQAPGVEAALDRGGRAAVLPRGWLGVVAPA